MVFPEQTVTGYPAEDLWLKPHFLDAARAAVDELASEVEGDRRPGRLPRARCGHLQLRRRARRTARSSAVYRKVLLPNYGVFDERRYFEPGDTPALIEVAGARVGLTICEDIWYPGPPASVEALAGASLIVNPSASPYQRGRGAYRERMVQERARETGAAFAVCNLVGGQDELVFDGHSVVVSQDGRDPGSRRPVRRGARASATWSSPRVRPPSGRAPTSPSRRGAARGRHRPRARPARGTRAERQRRAASRRAAGAGCGGL